MRVDSAAQQSVPAQTLLSELYAEDARDAVLLAEYPSSNSDQTRFKNTQQFIIHDPFPPPPPELLKCLGPHHLMFGWGDQLAVTSQSRPPEILVDHWCDVLGPHARPRWIEFDDLPDNQDYIVLFPHESLSADQQLLDPAINYFLHSKQVIEQINCAQAEVFDSVQFPCIAKLSHGYAGLSNYVLRNQEEERQMRELLSERWPTAELVFNSIIENIVEDVGVQFYLKRDGTVCWLGFTEQKFNESGKWCGGLYSADKQMSLAAEVDSFVSPVAQYLTSQGCFGVIGIDIIRSDTGDRFLVDVNPRLTGITPFLMASRVFSTDAGLVEGIYKASCCFAGSLEQLLERIRQISAARIMVLSAYDDQAKGQTICHLSATASTQLDCTSALSQLLGQDITS